MNPTLEIAGFEEHSSPGWMCLVTRTPAVTMRVYANEDAQPQFLLGTQGDADPALVERLLAALERVDVRRETASAFALPAAIAPFDTLGFVRGEERRLLRGVVEEDGVLQAFPMFACELTDSGQMPRLANFRRWTNLLALDRCAQPWFHFRMHGEPSGLQAQQWAQVAWTTFEDYVAILSNDATAWLEVRNRQGRILRIPDAQDWDGAMARIGLHVGRWRARGG